MCPGGYPIKDAENWQSAFLPGAYQGTFIDPQHTELERLIENIRARTPRRRPSGGSSTCCAASTPSTARAGADARLDARIQSFEMAFRMQMEAADAFDIAREPQADPRPVRPGVHGRQTLIARRLLERGVRYVQLWHGAGQPWDNHAQIERNHRSWPPRSTARSPPCWPTSSGSGCSTTRW